jgi:acyl-[acyl-carrier-protein]-phospholipid O-acyltransferase/long-chain-fatty-acid--[acyl-carrier-protein] ligase
MHSKAPRPTVPHGATVQPGACRARGDQSASESLWHRGYLALMATQFLGALNDNLFKVIVSLLAVGAVAEQQSGGGTLSLATLMVILPYLLLSGYAAYLADTRPKRSTIILVKLAELALTALILLAFFFDSLKMMMALLFLMAAQSAFFAPLKYGILPDIVCRRTLARANGALELGRYAAVILGTASGGLLLSVAEGSRVPVSMALVSVAGLGVLSSLFIPSVEGELRHGRLALNPWSELGTGLRRLRAAPDLAVAVAGLGCFEFTAVLVLLDMLLLGGEVMGLSNAAVGGLGAMTGLGAGLGCVLAGWLCRERLRPNLVPPAALAIATTLLTLAAAPPSFSLATVGLLVGGLFGGIVFVPLNAMLQDRAPDDERGLILATSNWLSMAAVLAAAGLLWVLHDLVAIPAVLILGYAALPMTLFAGWSLVAQPEFRLGAGHQAFEPNARDMASAASRPDAHATSCQAMDRPA